MPLLLRRVNLTGLEHLPQRPPYIVAANHLSYLDAPLLASLVGRWRNQQMFFLTKLPVVKLFRPIGAEGWLGMIPVDPANRALSLQPASERLAEGKVIGIFPEGTRNRQAHGLLPGKTGVARLAHISGVPVVPVGLTVPKGLSSATAIKLALFGGAELRISIGQPLVFDRHAAETLTKERITETTRIIMRAIGRQCGQEYAY